MKEILHFEGTAPALYSLLGPLVMNPKVLKQNNNFPFRTAENYLWFVAREEDNVLGFVPVENRRSERVINNYFVREHDAELLQWLLEDVLAQQDEKKRPWAAVVLAKDVDVFRALGFEVDKVWTRYVKMRKALGTRHVEKG